MNFHSGQSLKPESRRRKVRKGTHSCWECKRRKVKCTFASPTDAICIICRRRGAKCLSQELEPPDEPSQTADNAGHVPGDEGMQSSISRGDAILPTPDTSSASTPSVALHEGSLDITPRIRDDARTQLSLHPIDTPEPQQPSAAVQIVSTKTGRYQKIYQALRQALPSQKDIEILLSRVSGVSMLCYKSNLRLRSTLEKELRNKEPHLIDLMNPEAHPVLLARQMLFFAAALQYFSPSEEIPGLTEPHRVIMERLAESAISLVTTNDVLLGTMECLECIILEGFYHIDGGNVRRSWIVFRRAIMAAQIMGLQRPDHFPVKYISPQNNLDPQAVWLSIVHLDCLLSLLLGLPSSNVAPSFTICLPIGESLTENELPCHQMRVLARILERNELGVSESAFDMTREIDLQLVKIAESLPATFWRPVNFTGIERDSMEAFWESRRSWDHMSHYTLLNQLHLPYMLCPGTDRKNEYSRITCINASREVLIRVISFRTFNPITACCRMGDFLALIAGMTLMLAHIVCHCNEETENLLIHQRIGDRTTVEQALECMESISKLSEDVLSGKCATLLKHLLLVESDAAQGQSYRAHKVQWTNGDHEDECNVLLITVPYVGTIRIARDGIRPMLDLEISSQREQSLLEGVTIGGIGSVHVRIPKSPYSTTEDLLPELASRTNITASTPSLSVQPSDATLDLSTTSQLPHTQLGDASTQQDVLYPDVAAGLDDWVFQGVDTAFFDNLMRGV